MKKVIKLSSFFLILLIYNGALVHSEEGKDHIKAFFMSFALPGLGQYYAESPGNARIFIASELAILGTYYYNTVMKKAYRDDYLSYAALHAGVNPEGLGSSYLNALGSFNSSFEYNNYKQKISYTPVLYYGDKMWNWETKEKRLRFKNLRERELDYENYIKYCMAGIILNHFLSGLNAAKLVQNKNNTNTALNVNVLTSGLAVNYFWSF